MEEAEKLLTTERTNCAGRVNIGPNSSTFLLMSQSQRPPRPPLINGYFFFSVYGIHSLKHSYFPCELKIEQLLQVGHY